MFSRFSTLPTVLVLAAIPSWAAGQTSLPFGQLRPVNTDASTDVNSDLSPSLQTDGQGTWVCAWQRNSPVMPGSGPITSDVLVAKSTDDGQTWSTPTVVSEILPDGVMRHASRPRVVWAGSGVWGVAWGTPNFGDDVLLVRSTDDAETFSDAVRVATSVSFRDAKSDRNGTWVIVGANFGGNVFRSMDDGVTWSPAPSLGTPLGGLDVDADGNWLAISFCAAAVFESADGFLTATSRSTMFNDGRSFEIRSGPNDTWLSAGAIGSDFVTLRSIDDGASWTLQNSTPLNLGDPSNVRSDIAVSSQSEWLVVWHSDQPLSVLSSASQDNGGSWSPPRQVRPDSLFDPAADAGPTIATDGAGVWLVGFRSSASLPNAIGSDPDILVTTALPTCGDGMLDDGEQCDDGNTNHRDACGTDCEINSCGDNFVNTSLEECDDGNVLSGDGCSDTCLSESDDPTRIFLVAQGQNPANTLPGMAQEVVVAPGTTIDVEAYIQSPRGLSTYELAWPCSIAGDQIGSADLEHVQTIQIGPPHEIVDSSALVDANRSDWVYAGDAGVIPLRDPGFCSPSASCSDGTDCPNNSACDTNAGSCTLASPRIGAIPLTPSSPITLPGQVRYLGEIGYAVPQGADGTYALVFECCQNSSGCTQNSGCTPWTAILGSEPFFTHDGLLVVVDRLEACCLPDGSCEDVEPTDCDLMGGTSGGPLTDCGDDADNDGVWPQCGDECPNNPAKTEPGICGCNAPDNDTDADGVVDCVDGCPFDPDKTAPGLCGCGQEESNCAPVPTVSGFGMLILSLGLAGGLVWRQRRSGATV